MTTSRIRPLAAVTITALLAMTTACGGSDKSAETTTSSTSTSTTTETATTQASAAESTGSESSSPDASSSESTSSDASSSESSSTSDSASSSSEADPSASTKPGTPIPGGLTLKGRDYTYQVPKGWKDMTARMKSQGVETIAIRGDDKDGFADNINTAVTPGVGDMGLDMAEAAMKAEVTKAGGKSVKLLPRTTLGGLPAASQTALMGEGKSTYRVIQHLVLKDGKSYVVTLSGNGTATPEQVSAQFKDVLASWTWK